MRLPADSAIAGEKFTRYLLVPQAQSDKSRYLARGGYILANVGQLIADIRTQILPLDAVFSRRTKFGETWRIDGALSGPSGRRISIRTIWLKHALSGAVHFVTLIPKPASSA